MRRRRRIHRWRRRGWRENDERKLDQRSHVDERQSDVDDGRPDVIDYLVDDVIVICIDHGKLRIDDRGDDDRGVILVDRHDHG